MLSKRNIYYDKYKLNKVLGGEFFKLKVNEISLSNKIMISEDGQVNVYDKRHQFINILNTIDSIKSLHKEGGNFYYIRNNNIIFEQDSDKRRFMMDYYVYEYYGKEVINNVIQDFFNIKNPYIARGGTQQFKLIKEHLKSEGIIIES